MRRRGCRRRGASSRRARATLNNARRPSAITRVVSTFRESRVFPARCDCREPLSFSKALRRLPHRAERGLCRRPRSPLATSGVAGTATPFRQLQSTDTEREPGRRSRRSADTPRNIAIRAPPKRLVLLVHPSLKLSDAKCCRYDL